MTLCELLPDIYSWDVNILATNISNSAGTQASLGATRSRCGLVYFRRGGKRLLRTVRAHSAFQQVQGCIRRFGIWLSARASGRFYQSVSLSHCLFR